MKHKLKQKYIQENHYVYSYRFCKLTEKYKKEYKFVIQLSQKLHQWLNRLQFRAKELSESFGFLYYLPAGYILPYMYIPTYAHPYTYI